MSIFMSKFVGDDYSAMQGPCPSGFHVPSKDEWVALCGILTTTFGMSSDKTTMETYLKMPSAGFCNYSATVSNKGTHGLYWSSSYYSSHNDYAYGVQFHSSTLNPSNASYRSYGLSIRPFKDSPATPNSSWTALYSNKIYHNSALGLISISGDGNTWITIADKNLGATTVFNSGDTLSEFNCGKYYQRGNNYGFPRTGPASTSSAQVNAQGYGPGNYYNSSTYITRSSSPLGWDSSNNNNLRGGVTGVVRNTGEPKKIYIRVNAQPITTSGIYHNSDLGLISLSSDGSNWITIADKNLGATQVYNDGDALSEANCGKYYQWGNNYGFPFTGSVTTSSSQVNAQNYGPGNYYSSSTFIIRPSSPYSWDSSDNRNLWGGTTGTVEAMQGPCASGFHIPTKDENVALCGILINSLGLAQDGSTASTYLKMPYSGRRAISDGNTQLVGTSGVYRSSTAVDNTTGAYNMSIGSGTLGGEYGTNRPMGASIRPFKNEAVKPDDSRTKLY